MDANALDIGSLLSNKVAPKNKCFKIHIFGSVGQWELTC